MHSNQSILRLAIPAVFLGLIALVGSPARAEVSGQRLGRGILSNLLSTGGYFLTDGSGKAALGDVKFMSDLTIYARPARFRNFEITGGLEIFSLDDHFFPFTSGNGFSLIGPAFRLSGRRRNPIRPYIGGGLYIGSITSERLNYSSTSFAPGLEIGVDWKVQRYITITTSYRAQTRVGGVSTNGFGLMFRLF